MLKQYNVLFKVSVVLLLLSLFAMPLKADIIFDFQGNHPTSGKSKAVLQLKNSYIFGTEITTKDFVKLRFDSRSQHFTLYPKEIIYLYAGLNIDGKLSTTSGNFQFYFDATYDRFFGLRTEGTWRAGNYEKEGHLGRWVLRKQGFKQVCLSRDNFHKAASRGDLAYVNQCLEVGMDINRQEGNGWTALHSAVSKGHMNVVKRLLKQGAKLIKDKSGRTPLDYAVRAKKYNMMSVLSQSLR